MKLRNLLKSVCVQGPVTISTWHDDAEIVLFDTDDFEAHRHEITGEVLNMEIKYIFPRPAYSGNGAALAIELKPKEED